MIRPHVSFCTMPLRAMGLVCGIAALAASPAAAQDYPSRPMTLVIPFAAGGPSDVTGRIVAQRLSEVLNQQVIVDNVGGAGGTIASNRVARAAPDGYQFILANSGTHSWSQALYKRPPYDSTVDFAPVTLVTTGARVLVAAKSLPADTLPAFVTYVKANQDTLKWASAGPGSASHIGCVLLNSVMGVNVTHIPYRGAAPAMQDVVAGRVEYMCDAISTALPQIRSNSVKAIANLAGSRAAVLPELKTAREQGLADLDISSWQGIFLPKGTPDAIVARLARALSETIDTPAVRRRLEELGDQTVPPDRRGPEYLARFLREDIAKWTPAIKASGVSVD